MVGFFVHLEFERLLNRPLRLGVAPQGKNGKGNGGLISLTLELLLENIFVDVDVVEELDSKGA